MWLKAPESSWTALYFYNRRALQLLLSEGYLCKYLVLFLINVPLLLPAAIYAPFMEISRLLF